MTMSDEATKRRSERGRRGPCVALLVVVVCIAATVMGGCVASVTPPASDRSNDSIAIQPLADDAWPARYPEQLRALIEQEEKPTPEFADPSFDESHAANMNPGMLRVFHVLTSERPERAEQIYGKGVVHSFGEQDDGTHHFLYVTNRLPPAEFESLAKDSALLEDPDREKVLRWRFRLRPHLGDTQRGIVVHLPSIGNRRYENKVNEAFRRRGWSVLSALPPQLTIRVIETGADVSPPVVTSGESLAKRLDAFAADYAYAVEGTLQYLRTWHPDVQTKPVAVVGYSAGALAASSVAARLNEDVKAAIFVGGGANVAEILLESDAAKLGYRVRVRHGAAVADELALLPQRYLEACTFDPYHIAPMLRSIPVLMVDGSFDQIIPERNRTLLYERLHEPEQWSYPVGHVFLFWMLPTQAKAITDWLDDAVRSPENAAPDANSTPNPSS